MKAGSSFRGSKIGPVQCHSYSNQEIRKDTDNALIALVLISLPHKQLL